MEHTTDLPDDPALLKQMICELTEQLQKSRRHEEHLLRKIDELVRKLFGRKAERIDPNQLSLVDLAALGISSPPAAEEPEPETAPPAAPRRRPRRRRPPKELPRRRVEHTLEEAERLCPCCKVPMEVIREEIHEQLDYLPASFEVVEHVRFVYACHKGCDEAVETAVKPPQLIEKGLPGPGLLAHVITSKYADHQPLNRLENIFSRQGVEIARSTMCDWVRAVSDHIAPLVEHMKSDVLRSYCVATDDTPVTVLTPGEKGSRKGRLWTYVGDDEHPWTVFDYTPTRERDGPMRFLEGFEGYLQADAYSGYDEIYRTRPVLEVGCWMHARRYFYEASQASPARPCEALAIISRLFQIEKKCKSFSAAQRLECRKAESIPILDTMEEWLHEQTLKTPPKSALGAALTYTRNQWLALRRYAEDGRLPIDNGRSERALRLIAVGRKNWLFAGSDAGGERAARIYTLIVTCRHHRLDPFHYLLDLLRSLPETPAEQMHELTPLAWAAKQSSAVDR